MNNRQRSINLRVVERYLWHFNTDEKLNNALIEIDKKIGKWILSSSERSSDNSYLYFDYKIKRLYECKNKVQHEIIRRRKITQENTWNLLKSK